MSAKALFYFILKCSPQIEKEMMSKYLENPLNPMMFVEYDQSCEGFMQLDLSDPASNVKRIMHIDKAYHKFDVEGVCNVLSIGREGTRKSSLLNQVFGYQFETMMFTYDQKSPSHQCRLFHDAVDVVFASKDIKHMNETIREEV